MTVRRAWKRVQPRGLWLPPPRTKVSAVTGCAAQAETGKRRISLLLAGPPDVADEVLGAAKKKHTH